MFGRNRAETRSSLPPEAFMRLRRDFDVAHLYQDFVRQVNVQGLSGAKMAFRELLYTQIFSHFKEKQAHEVTPYQLFEVGPVQDDTDRQLYFIDPLYPSAEQVSIRTKRAADAAGVKANIDAAHRALFERYHLEHQQTEYLSKYFGDLFETTTTHLLEHPEHLNQPVQLPNIDRATGWKGDWVALLLPSSPVHGDVGSIIYVYRPVVLKVDDGIQFLIESQGVFHQLPLTAQVHRFVSPAQQPTTITEQSVMELVATLPPELQRLELLELLYQIGNLAGIPDLAQRHQNQLQIDTKITDSIEQITQTLLGVFEREYTTHPSSTVTARQGKRLQTAFEPLMHQLLVEKVIPSNLGSEVLAQYHLLEQGQSRNAYMKTLAVSFPSLLQRAAGWSICGFSSYGGLTEYAAASGNLNGLSALGLNSEHCKPKQCPRCNTMIMSMSATRCPRCHLSKKEAVGYQPPVASAPTAEADRQAPLLPNVKHPTVRSVSFQDVLSGRDNRLVA